MQRRLYPVSHLRCRISSFRKLLSNNCHSIIMKTYAILIIVLLLAGCVRKESETDLELKSLYAQLDSEIAGSGNYESAKEKRIGDFRDKLSRMDDGKERIAIIDTVIGEYEAFNADSALYYIGYGLQDAKNLGDKGREELLCIRRADILAHAGLFSDAISVMERVPKHALDNEGKEKYYSTYCAIYQYLSEYTNEHEPAAENERLRRLYVDSLSMIASPESFDYLVNVMAERARSGNVDETIALYEEKLKDYSPGSREYSIIASILSYLYKNIGNIHEYKRYLVLSAISDVKGAVKENMSFRELASSMFEDGDIERANKYLKKSIADANFYSAMMRNAQSGKMLPLIDEAYTTARDQLTTRLRVMVWISGVLSAVLLLTLFMILKQMRSLRKAKDKVSRANEELSQMSQQLQLANSALQASNNDLKALSEELKEANGQLAARNLELKEYNRIKEQYAALFMEYCSSAISSLQHYQQTLRKLILQGGNKAAILKKLDSTETTDQMLKNFYGRFDEAILNIYPDFVEKFNALLNADSQVLLKSGEILNTELRLFALIRIGIEDSAKIADFLRCSISTVYTYRSKMRKRAIDQDNFEENLKNIL